MSKKIVLASNNKKKMKEMQELLAPMCRSDFSRFFGNPFCRRAFRYLCGKCAGKSQMGSEAFRSSGHCR